MKSIIHIYVNDEGNLDAGVCFPENRSAIMEINLVLDMIKSDMIEKAKSLTGTDLSPGEKLSDDGLHWT